MGLWATEFGSAWCRSSETGIKEDTHCLSIVISADLEFSSRELWSQTRPPSGLVICADSCNLLRASASSPMS